MRIEITEQPYALIALEALCAVARQQGFPDEARVSINGTSVTVRCEPEGLVSVQAHEARVVCDSRGPRIGEDVPRCRRPVGHSGVHRPDLSDGFGSSLTWGNL